MKNTLFIFSITFIFCNTFAAEPIKVAILDFENTSGISKYDGFGKALSNMLITDLTKFIRSQDVIFLERSQLNKILEEQNLQKSKNFDKGTAVHFGKLAGVKYVLVGSVYVLDGTCNISSRLVDVETSEIVYAEESNGNIVNWLSLKSKLAQDLSESMKHPIKLSPNLSNGTTEEAIEVYAKSIYYTDNNQLDSAYFTLQELKYSFVDFTYTNELLDELYEEASKSQTNIKLRQKGFILNLHDKMTGDPEKDWKRIEQFWDGPLDEAYPYLEYVFLEKVYEMFKDSSKWMGYDVNRYSASCDLGDLILYSLANHAYHADERTKAIYYQNIRSKKYPFSELDMVLGLPVADDAYILSKIDINDTLYIDYLIKAQGAAFYGIGSRIEFLMQSCLEELMPLIELDFYDFVATEKYFSILDKHVPILNPYHVLGNLIVLVGTETQSKKFHDFISLHKEKKIYGQEINTHSFFSHQIEDGLIFFMNSFISGGTFTDYQNKNWITDLDTRYHLIVQNKNGEFVFHSYYTTLFALTKSAVFAASDKFKESYNILDAINKDVLKTHYDKIFYGKNIGAMHQAMMLICAVKLGKVDDVKWHFRQLKIAGHEPGVHLNLHTEFLD